MSEIADIEVAIRVALAVRVGPLSLSRVEAQLPRVDDHRRIAEALMHLERGGQIRYVGCDAGHNHDGLCLIEVAQ